jgi:uncharacterized membrane protein
MLFICVSYVFGIENGKIDRKSKNYKKQMKNENRKMNVFTDTIDLKSFTSIDYTFHFDKYSCVRQMWYFHIATAYIVAISGFLCFMTRLYYTNYHKLFGRIYILGMLWCTATSMLIHNTGLPLGVLISFVWVLGGLTIGWILISIHQSTLESKAFANLSKRTINIKNLEIELKQEKNAIVSSKSTFQKVISFKGFHGMIMFTSWINITGRIFASNQSGDFTCYTYPVYKPIDSHAFKGAGKNITFVESRNPLYNKLPWANREATWGILLLFGPLLGAFIVGLVYSFYSTKKRSKSTESLIAIVHN